MSNLDSYHPFRASVQHKEQDSSSSNDNNAANNNNKLNEDDKEFTPRLSWKTKLRLLLGGGAALILYYVVSTALAWFDPVEFSENKQEPSFLEEMHQETEESQTDLFFDKSDLNERGRTIEEARSKAGFLKSIFCQGGKRSSFICD